MSFVIDTKGQRELLVGSSNPEHNTEDSEDDFQFIPLTPKSSAVRLKSTSKCKEGDLDSLIPDSYFDFDYVPSSSRRPTLKSVAERFSRTEAILHNSVLKPGVEKLESLPSYDEGHRQLLRKRKMEHEKSAGSKWFNMKAPEITEELKNDLEVLKMRSALDPKHFYKKNDFKSLPKYFQVGRVVESAADFYHSRIPKKQRKKTLVEELLADAEFQNSTKKRYKKIIADSKISRKKKNK